ncbi:MAG TPA: hypothetical protein VEG84_08810 [Thermoanaerobaculia bacterium]|nr:hypothetical protein [Thermoanaerobaculia bacterium]
MTSTKPDPSPTSSSAAPPFSKGGPDAAEHGLCSGADRSQRDGSRIILYERLTGDAARKRAMGAEPLGAGMSPEAVEQIEYIEVWSTPGSADGYDFRMYSFGGALIACRSTRGH